MNNIFIPTDDGLVNLNKVNKIFINPNTIHNTYIELTIEFDNGIKDILNIHKDDYKALKHNNFYITNHFKMLDSCKDE